jgi:MFS family permease
MIAGSTNVFITDRVGLGIVSLKRSALDLVRSSSNAACSSKATPFGASMQGIGYVLACWGPPFPLFVIAYIFNGFGLGLLDAQANSLVTRLPGANTKMFLMHAIYGFGATVSPLVATEFVKRERDRVYLYFLVSLGLAFVCVTTLIVVFQFRTDDQVVGRRDPSASEDFVPHGERSSSEGEKDMRLDSLPTTDERTGIIDSQAGEPVVSEKRQDEVGGSGNKMKRILKIPTVHFMAFYIAIYVSDDM